MAYARYLGLMTSVVVSILAVTEAQSQQLNETSNPLPKSTSLLLAESPRKIGHNLTPDVPVEISPTTNITSEAKDDKRAAAKSNDTLKPRAFAVPKALSLPPANKLSTLEKAYLDVYAILREENSCSSFYGGPRAIDALNELIRQIKPAYFERAIALRMKGSVMYAFNNTTGLSYRVFEKAEINANGPFYRMSIFPADSSMSRVGEFMPNTREARMTILLHELGHMIEIAKGRWVLPNDGNDSNTSKENTKKVIEICRKQIKSRALTSFEQELALIQSPASVLLAASEPVTNGNHMTPTASESLRQNESQADATCESCKPEIQNPQDR